MFDSDIISKYYKEKLMTLRLLFELMAEDEDKLTELLNGLHAFTAYQEAVVDFELFSRSLSVGRKSKRSVVFILTQKDRARIEAHDRCILVCKDINEMCDKYGVPPICDFNTDDRHKVARFVGEIVRAWYIEGIMPGLRTISDNALSSDEIAEVVKAAESLDIPVEMLVFNDERVLMGIQGTCYHRDEDKIYVVRDIFPDQGGYPTHARDMLNVRCILAIEYYGHRKKLLEDLSTVYDWKNEVTAVVETARFAPKLTQFERAGIYDYAGVIAEEHGYTFKLDEHMNSVRFGDGTVEPKDESIKYMTLQEIYDMVDETKRDLYGHETVEDDKIIKIAEEMMDKFDESFKELAK